jgi:hypothetical protein
MLMLSVLVQGSVHAAERPVVEYLFDENPGFTIRDTSGNGLHGRVQGTIDHTAPVWAGGRNNTGMQFNGWSDLINLGDRDELDLERYTIMAWVRYQNTPPADAGVPLRAEPGKRRNHEIIEKIGAYWLNIRLDTHRLRSGGRFGGPSESDCLGELPGHSDSVDSIIPVPENRWTHVATTYNGTKLKVFIDGKLVGAKAVAKGKCASNHPAVLGAKYTPRPYKIWPTGYVSNHFNGTLDEVRIYDYALSGPEIRAGLGAGAEGETTAPLGGAISGMTPRKVRCRLGDRSWVTVSRNESEWLCVSPDPSVISGDSVRQLIVGRAAGPEISGTVSGMESRKIRCDNRSTGVKRSRTLFSVAWSCETVGVPIRKGDEVRVTLIGAAD